MEAAYRHVVWHDTRITGEQRARLTGQKPCVLWFTGLSGSGKSTIANAVEEALYGNGNFTYLLDGDNIRHGLNSDLGFDDAGRVENIRRIAEVSRLFVDSGLIVLTAFISPFRRDREMVRDLLGEGEFVEIYVDAPIEECERRDPKGLYRKAREGKIRDFTGIDSPYEAPEQAEIHIENHKMGIEEARDAVIGYLREKEYIRWKR